MKKIEILYPEFGGIYGERYNVDYLMRSCPELTLIETAHGQVPAFTKGEADMVYLGCTPEKHQEEIIELLRPYKEDILREIERGTIFLITGNAIEIFGNRIKDGDRVIDCLSMFDFESIRYMDKFRHNSQYVGKANLGGEEITLLGHRSQFSFAYGDFNDYFIDIEIGMGMNKSTKREGIRKNNFYATYSLGPYLILNPLFAKYLLRLMDLPDALCFEKEIMEAYEYRKNELIEKLGILPDYPH